MTLFDLKGVIDFTFDLQDDEVCGSFYIELDEISNVFAKEIEVVKMERQYLTCKLTDFLKKHSEEVEAYLDDNYNEGEQLEWLKKILVESEDITVEGGEAVYHFLVNDMYDFLTEKRDEPKEKLSMYEVIFSIDGISNGPEMTDVLAASSQEAVDAVKGAYSGATISRVAKYMTDWK